MAEMIMSASQFPSSGSVMAKKPLSPGPVQSTTSEYDEKWFDRSTKTHHPIENEILDNSQHDNRIDHEELSLPVLPGDQQTKACQQEERDWHEKGHIPHDLR